MGEGDEGSSKELIFGSGIYDIHLELSPVISRHIFEAHCLCSMCSLMYGEIEKQE